jgi:hypothetical protein
VSEIAQIYLAATIVDSLSVAWPRVAISVALQEPNSTAVTLAIGWRARVMTYAQK